MLQRLRSAYRLYRFAARDARTPLSAKVLPWLSLLYVFWPLDVIPDFIPLLGQVDDVGVIVLLCILALRMIPTEVRKDAKRNVIDV